MRDAADRQSVDWAQNGWATQPVLDERPWSIVGFSSSGSQSSTSGDTDQIFHVDVSADGLAELAQVTRHTDVVAVLAPGCAEDFLRTAPRLLADTPREGAWAMLLVPWKEPPIYGRRNDGPVWSFACTSPLMQRLLANAGSPVLAELSFLLLHGILNRVLDVEALWVRQVKTPVELSGFPHPLDTRASLIMAHRGPFRFLEAALSLIDRAASAAMVTVRVGLDIADESEYFPLAGRSRRREMFVVGEDAPVGPYAIRQYLIDQSTEDFIVFQDSDDLSCSDRFEVQYGELRHSGADLVGCQELVVDEINGRVDAMRFPLDVTNALRREGSAAETFNEEEPLLHPTVMVWRQKFVDSGGFSTDQRIANDTQFMLRAFFAMKMRNSGEFLYVRRRHPNALTVAPETAAGCALRRELGTRWSVDFDAIKRGRLTIAGSSLRARVSSTPYRFRPVVMEEGPRAS
jgi:hypothetical protein